MTVPLQYHKAVQVAADIVHVWRAVSCRPGDPAALLFSREPLIHTVSTCWLLKGLAKYHLRVYSTIQLVVHILDACAAQQWRSGTSTLVHEHLDLELGRLRRSWQQ